MAIFARSEHGIPYRQDGVFFRFDILHYLDERGPYTQGRKLLCYGPGDNSPEYLGHDPRCFECASGTHHTECKHTAIVQQHEDYPEHVKANWLALGMSA
jgi:hypothetical protein